MKNLYESIFDDNDIINDVDNSIKKQVMEFIMDNYVKWRENELHDNDIIVKWSERKQLFIVSFNNIKELIVRRGRRMFLDSLNNNGMFEFGNMSDLGFYCYDCSNLKTLEGAPKKVRYFNCSNCSLLKDLTGAPTNVSDLFTCSNCNNLITLKGAPKQCYSFECSYCPSLKNLTGSPKNVGKFICTYCTNLISLKGSPKKVEYSFDCEGCSKLTSLKGAPEEVGQMNCWRCINIKKIDWQPTLLYRIFHSGLPEDELKELIDKTGAENSRG